MLSYAWYSLALSSLLLGSLTACQPPVSPPITGQIDLHGTSQLIVENQTEQPVNAVLSNWQLLPSLEQAMDTTVAPGATLRLSIHTQGELYYDLSLADTDFKLFAQPQTSCRIILGRDSSWQFEGELAEINAYLRQKSLALQSVNAEWMPRTNFTHGGYDIPTLIAGNDSITQLQLRYLAENGQHLPAWYQAFEQKRQRYLHAGFVLNSLAYRKVLMGINETTPPDILDRVLGDLPPQDTTLLGSLRYYQFLGDYLSSCKDPQYEAGIPNSPQEWATHLQKGIDMALEKLDEPVRSHYLAYSLGNLLKRKRPFFQEEWLTLVQDSTLHDHLQTLWAAQPLLPPGDQVPLFYLRDPQGEFYTPDDFRGKVVLLNFWATWCKPCLQEFPHENQLVEQFQGQAVQVINICLDSREERWRQLIETYDLRMLNLYAIGNWNDKLYQSFGIQSLPHSVLIDPQGKIVENQCRRASEGIAADIQRLLDQRTAPH